MIKRSLDPLTNRSFFLFGARGTGKTTWLQSNFMGDDDLYINLLDDDTEERYSKRPGLLDAELKNLQLEKKLPRFVVIDEIQKIPKLLDIAQTWIQQNKLKFVLTGSSSRKLKRGAANLLGGRANSYSLFPFTARELGRAFDLSSVLQWGTLPECFFLETDREKSSYLRSYTKTYLKEEILVEQLIRKLPPFRGFLELLSQNDGNLLSYEKFAKDIGVDHKTIQAYLEILEDTYLGILLRPYHPSLRKSQLQQPKFYFFDPGVRRQLNGTLGTPLLPSTSAFGSAFEAWLIHEIIRTSTYAELDFKFGFYRSKHGAEVDLILSKGRKNIFVEIKSAEKTDLSEVRELSRLVADFPGEKKVFYISRDKTSLREGSVHCCHYLDFLDQMPKL